MFIKTAVLLNSGFSLLLQKLGISLAVLDTAGNAAQSRGGDIGLGDDLVIGLALHQQPGGITPLGHIFNFFYGAQIVKQRSTILGTVK